MTNNRFAINGKIRLITIAVLAVILMGLLFSSCYIVKEADHDCTGSSCPICTMIEQCKKVFKQLGTCQAAAAVVAAIVYAFYLTLCSTDLIAIAQTLVNRKVKLNN